MGSIILPLQRHAVFWSSWLSIIVVPKQTTAAQLESQLYSGQQPQIPSVLAKRSVSCSGEEKTHLICDWKKTIFPPSSCAFHISLNCISYHQCAREASCGDVRTPPSRLRVVKELLLLRGLEQCLEWAQAASLGETFLFLNRVKGHWQPSDSSNQSGTQEQFQQKDPK